MQNLFSHLGFTKIKIHFFQIITLCLILGIFCGHNNYDISLLISFLFFFILIIKLFYTQENKINFYKILIAIGIFFFGIFIYNQQQQNFNNFYLMVNNNNFDIVGTILDINKNDDSNLKNCLTIKVELLKNNKTQKCESANHTIQLHVNKLYGLKIDDQILVNNITFKQSISDSFRKYLIKEGLYYSLFLYNFSFIRLYRPDFSIKQKIQNLKTNIFYKIKSKMKTETFALFSSIFLGNKTYIKQLMEQPKEQFKIWGLSHYLARSGLHLVILIAIFQILMTLMGLSFYLKHALTFFLIILYNFLSWPSIPFIRSLIMFIFYQICLIFNLQINTLHLLNITTFIILLFNPIQLFFLDFQLSFGLTYALIWISHVSSQNKVLK